MKEAKMRYGRMNPRSRALCPEEGWVKQYDGRFLKRPSEEWRVMRTSTLNTRYMVM